jgi:chemotaxis protein methyltransferase CheR
LATSGGSKALTELPEIEFKLILEAIMLRYGYNFRQYAESSMQRRLLAIMTKYQLHDPMELLTKLIRDADFFHRALGQLTVTTSEMFRDPEFYRAFREQVIPHLRTYPTLNFWSAGCSTGEEMYSLAIMLKEEGLYDRSVIFATDINPRALKAAKEGIFPIEATQLHTRNYQDSGGKEAFSSYYVADYGLIKMDASLTENVVFSEHNLVSDHVFAECHVIFCRNVLIYFNRALQDRVLLLFQQSLRYGGFLGLGSKETLRFSLVATSFDVVSDRQRIYRRNSLHAGSREILGGGYEPL